MFFPSGRRNEIPSSRLFAVWRNRPQTEALFFLANPSNPSGGLLDAAALHRVVQSRPEVLWIIDESFMDYVQGAESLLREAALLPNLVVLRSLTKFTAWPASGAVFPSVPLRSRSGCGNPCPPGT